MCLVSKRLAATATRKIAVGKEIVIHKKGLRLYINSKEVYWETLYLKIEKTTLLVDMATFKET